MIMERRWKAQYTTSCKYFGVIFICELTNFLPYSADVLCMSRTGNLIHLVILFKAIFLYGALLAPKVETVFRRFIQISPRAKGFRNGTISFSTVNSISLKVFLDPIRLSMQNYCSLCYSYLKILKIHWWPRFLSWRFALEYNRRFPLILWVLIFRRSRSFLTRVNHRLKSQNLHIKTKILLARYLVSCKKLVCQALVW